MANRLKKSIFDGLRKDRIFFFTLCCSADIYSTYGPRNCVSTNKAFCIGKENKNLFDHVKDQYSSYTNMILTVHRRLLWLYITNWNNSRMITALLIIYDDRKYLLSFFLNWNNRYNYSRTITALLIIYDGRMYFVSFFLLRGSNGQPN